MMSYVTHAIKVFQLITSSNMNIKKLLSTCGIYGLDVTVSLCPGLVWINSNLNPTTDYFCNV